MPSVEAVISGQEQTDDLIAYIMSDGTRVEVTTAQIYNHFINETADDPYIATIIWIKNQLVSGVGSSLINPGRISIDFDRETGSTGGYIFETRSHD